MKRNVIILSILLYQAEITHHQATSSCTPLWRINNLAKIRERFLLSADVDEYAFVV